MTIYDFEFTIQKTTFNRDVTKLLGQALQQFLNRISKI